MRKKTTAVDDEKLESQEEFKNVHAQYRSLRNESKRKLDVFLEVLLLYFTEDRPKASRFALILRVPKDAACQDLL